MSSEIELGREIAESEMDQDVKNFLRHLILLPEGELTSKRVIELVESLAGESK
jgi:hypothetical protein